MGRPRCSANRGAIIWSAPFGVLGFLARSLDRGTARSRTSPIARSNTLRYQEPIPTALVVSSKLGYSLRACSSPERIDYPCDLRVAMDLSLYGRVLWRFRWLVALGLILAVALSLLSVAKVSSRGLSYRKHEVWQSSTTVLLTQHGFPWGRAVVPPAQTGATAGPGWLAGLTQLYAQFANSDQVKALMLRDGASKNWTLTAAPVVPPGSSSALPVIALAGLAYTPAGAVQATLLGRTAFLQYVKGQQASADIPNNERVDLQVLQNLTPPIVVQSRKKTLPIVIFLAVLSATIGLAFILENARPRVKPVALAASAPEPVEHGIVRSRAEG